MRRRLIGESFSPWTEKARWALDHHRIGYAFREYQPLVEEPWLRLATRNFTRRAATVPVLLDGREVFADSYSIALHADRRGEKERLFLDSARSRIDAWNETSEALLRAGRALFLSRLPTHREALLDYVPPFAPKPIRPLFRPLVRTGIAYLQAKHGAGKDFADKAHGELDAGLSSLRDSLSGRTHLLDELSYADIAMAVVLQFVKPVDGRYIRLSRASREAWTHAELAREFADLVDWRDELYAKHRF